MNLSLRSTPTFDIRDFLDQLQPSKKKGKFICPSCGENNFTISKKLNERGVPDFNCWDDRSREHRREIKNALRPWAEVVDQRRAQGKQKGAVQPKGYTLRLRETVSSPLQAPQTAPLPSEGIELARLPQPATDSPQPRQKQSKQHHEALVWRFCYSTFQWVERIQWADEAKPKGYSKQYRQAHLAKDGEEVSVWKNGEQVGTRKAVMGEAVYSKGLDPWLAYRWEEALAAARSSNANFLLWCEGEPTAEAFRQLGFACTTLQGSDWSQEVIDDAVSRHKAENLGIIYNPDHDAAGYKKAKLLQQSCDRFGVPFLLIVPTTIDPEVPAKGDAVDLIAAIGGEEFIKRLEAEIHRQVELRQTESQSQEPDHKKQNGQTSTEIAAEIAEDYRHRLAWNDEAGLWYRYEADAPGVWSQESDIAIGAVVLAEFESRLGMGYKVAAIEQCLKILKWKLLVKKWEQPSDLLPFRNGVLNTQSGKFSAHAPGYRFTWSLPRDHNALATDWGTIEDWMNVATGGSTQIKTILLCWLNACLKGRSDLQRFLHLTGAGGTGKGTFIRLAISLVGGENNHASSLLDWCGNRFEPVNAYKKRLLSFADEDKYTGGLSNFKKVTGGDAIRGEVKNKQAFDFIFEGMVMLASNYPIFSGDTSSGIYRRLLMVPFNHIIPSHQRRNLDTDFEPELAALTNYVLSIPDEVVSQTLRQSVDQAPEVIERTWDWRMRQDSVAAWLNECVLHDPHACERVGNDREDGETLFGSYYRYCEQTGSRPKGSREFSPALLELVNNDPDLNWGVEKKRVSGGFMIHGLRLRKAGDIEQPYCLEALADVGSRRSVECDVGWNAEPEPLPGAGYVGCVGSEAIIEKNAISTSPTAPISPLTETLPGSDRTPYTPCTSEMQPAVGTLHPDPTVQDGHPTPTNQPVQLLTKEMLLRVVQSIAAISSVSTFEEFKGRYDQLSDAQQRQVWSAASPDIQQTYQHWQEAFLAVPQLVWEARKALLGVVTVSDMNEIRQRQDRAVLSTALKLIHESAQNSLKRLLKLSKQEQP